MAEGEEEEVLAQAEQEGEVRLLDVVDDEVKDEGEDDRGLTLEPLQPHGGIYEGRAQEEFHRLYAVDELHASCLWKTT